MFDLSKYVEYELQTNNISEKTLLLNNLIAFIISTMYKQKMGCKGKTLIYVKK